MLKELLVLTCLLVIIAKIEETEAAPQSESGAESKAKEGSGGSGGGKEAAGSGKYFNQS